MPNMRNGGVRPDGPPSRADHDGVAGLECDALPVQRGLEVRCSDGIGARQHVDAFVGCQVDEPVARHDRLEFLDVRLRPALVAQLILSCESMLHLPLLACVPYRSAPLAQDVGDCTDIHLVLILR